MGRLDGLSSREIELVAQRDGWVFSRQRGSHRIYGKTGVSQNLAIPVGRELPPGTVHAILSKMGMPVDEFLRLLRR